MDWKYFLELVKIARKIMDVALQVCSFSLYVTLCPCKITLEWSKFHPTVVKMIIKCHLNDVRKIFSTTCIFLNPEIS